MRKHTTSVNDKCHDLSYYVSRIQRHKRYVKIRWLNQHFPDIQVIVELESTNSIHAFKWFEEEGHVEWRYYNFRLIDLTQQKSYTVGIRAILDDEDEL